MIKKAVYYFLFALMATAFISGCTSKAKRLNERITLWHKDKIPYGTFYAYENLKYIFPEAEIIVNKKSPDRSKNFSLTDFSGSTDDYKYNGLKTAYIIISPRVLPDDNELAALMNFIGEGNHIFISSMQVGQTLLDSLQLKTSYFPGYYNLDDSMAVSIYDPLLYDSLNFAYPGKSINNYLVSMDTTYATILGKNERGYANFVRIKYQSGGSIYIHLEPMAFTNFFLLHKNNSAYYNHALSYLPKNVELIKWDAYFRHSEGNKSSKGIFSWLMSQPAFAWAASLLLILFLLIYLFETKRKQKIIPIIEPHKNASFDFVKTIGRLYFQRRDNKNLAVKMSTHFFDHVRSKFNIPTSIPIDEFVKRLVFKTGYNEKAIKDILSQIKTVGNKPAVSDEELMDFNKKLENFYKNT